MRNLTHLVRCHFLNSGIYKLVFLYFYSLSLCKVKNGAIFYVCLIWFGVAFGDTVLKVLWFWCSLRKIIGNQGLFGYNRYNFVENSNHLLRNICQYIFPTLCNTLFSKNSKYRIYNIDNRGDIYLCIRMFKEMIKNDEKNRTCEITKKK